MDQIVWLLRRRQQNKKRDINFTCMQVNRTLKAYHCHNTTKRTDFFFFNKLVVMCQIPIGQGLSVCKHINYVTAGIDLENKEEWANSSRHDKEFVKRHLDIFFLGCSVRLIILIMHRLCWSTDENREINRRSPYSTITYRMLQYYLYSNLGSILFSVLCT